MFLLFCFCHYETCDVNYIMGLKFSFCFLLLQLLDLSSFNSLFFFLLCFIEIPVFNANKVDPYQTIYSAASHVDLHCLPITLLGVPI